MAQIHRVHRQIRLQATLFSVAMVLLLAMAGCTSHPLIMPEPLKPGERFTGYMISLENGLPQYVFRWGLSERADLGLRVGLPPTQGNGVDMSYKLIEINNRIHSVNLGGSIGVDQNNNMSVTYLNSKKRPRKEKIRQGRKVFYKVSNTQFNYGYFGMRYMLIPSGMIGDRVHRFGFLYGINRNHRWGAELGYFHDFAGGEKLTPLGRPSEHAAITGLSVRFWIGGLRVK
ncbi:MAG: hypothetical protein K9N34_06775 [Candidatus Marinimicrobia bacterium]|nr:hypothetical protein [Candidatus Neomarinimicrobiota bacterium]MCF7840090.1 hypothetical protein [Candidatus Neomarinimicrobiota bacterium]